MATEPEVAERDLGLGEWKNIVELEKGMAGRDGRRLWMDWRGHGVDGDGVRKWKGIREEDSMMEKFILMWRCVVRKRVWAENRRGIEQGWTKEGLWSRGGALRGVKGTEFVSIGYLPAEKTFSRKRYKPVVQATLRTYFVGWLLDAETLLFIAMFLADWSGNSTPSTGV